MHIRRSILRLLGLVDVNGVADLLWIDALVEDGILLQRDGSLMAAWQYTGPDMESSEDSEINALVRRLSGAMKLGSRWMIHCDAIRSEAPGYPDGGAFPDPVSQAIDEERRQQFTEKGAQYATEYFLTLTYLPPTERELKLKGWVADDSLTSTAGQHIATFKSRIEQFENVFAKQLAAKRLIKAGQFDELLRYYHRCVTGHNHPIRIPEIPVGLNDIISSEDVAFGRGKATGRHVFAVGEKHVVCLSIDGFPTSAAGNADDEKSFPGILDGLAQLPIEYRWNTRAILMDPEEATELLVKDRKNWKGQERGFGDQMLKAQTPPDEHATAMVADARQATKTAKGNTVHFCQYTSVVVLMHEDLRSLNDARLMVTRKLQNLGFAVRQEKHNAMEAWRGSLPGDGYRNVRRVKLHTLNLADMLPVTSTWTGLEYCPSDKLPPKSPALMRMETTGSTPFRFNLHVGDVGHALVLGPIGSGKTTLTCTMAAQWFRYPKAQVFVFDYDYGAWLTTHALGGRHYDLSAQDDLSFCPLQHLSDWEDQAWAAAYIEDLCALNAVAVSPKQKNAISDAVKMIHDSSHRSITHFCLQVQDEAVKDALRHYTVDGMAGRLLDAEKDTLHLGGNRIVCFECKGLLQSQDKRTPMAVMRYLFRRIEKRLDGSPTLLILDEGHEYLKHELFAGKLDEWLLTLRKRNVAVVIATQQISHVMNSRIASTLIEQCPTKILLPNPECRNPAASRYYGEHGLGLNERELWMLQRAMPKRDYYVTSSLGRRMANLCMGDVGLAFCSVNAPQDRAAVERLMVAYPETWPSEWLRLRGAVAWADYLARREQITQCASA